MLASQKKLHTVIILLVIYFTFKVNSQIVKVKTGSLEGTEESTREGRKIYSFYGIPYAAPPIGKLRLKAPVEATPWEGIRKATQKPNMCMQPESFGVLDGPSMGNEDCLFLNVFTPNITKLGSGMPVMVYIHGGGYQSGQSVDYGPEYLLDYDVVYVSINYRLGSLGFLSLGNDLISGNYGLKDQQFALKWINTNIAAFGGNPGNVVIIGNSAGSASVNLHLFAPESKGLFQKAIMESGSAFATWAYYDVKRAKALGYALVYGAGCYSEEETDILECLQTIPADTFVRKESLLYTWGTDPAALFKPVIEPEISNAFISRIPSKDSYVSKDVIIMTGVTSAEGTFKVVEYFSGDGKSGAVLNANYKFLLPIALEYKFTAEPKNVDEITQKIKSFYFGDQAIEKKTDTKLVDAFTDCFFSYPFHLTLSTFPGGKRFAYLYDHRANYSFQDYAGYPTDLGVSHMDEVPLIFYQKAKDQVYSLTDVKVSKKLVKYWTNFATYGDPNGVSEEKVWKPVVSDATEYLRIGSDVDVMEKNLWEERMKFYKSLPLGARFQQRR